MFHKLLLRRLVSDNDALAGRAPKQVDNPRYSIVLVHQYGPRGSRVDLGTLFFQYIDIFREHLTDNFDADICHTKDPLMSTHILFQYRHCRGAQLLPTHSLLELIIEKILKPLETEIDPLLI